MVSNFDLRGTTSSSFQIGKNGATLYTATTLPNGTDGIDGDVWFIINGASSGIQQKMAGTWSTVSSGSVGELASLSPGLNQFIVGNGETWETLGGSTARTALGLTIGTNVEAWNANLDTIAGLSQGTNSVILSDGTNWTSSTLSLSSLNNVVLTSPTTGQVLEFNGTNWINGTGGDSTLSSLNDVSITSIASGDVLYFNGTSWVNSLPDSTSGVQPYNSNLTTIAGLSQGTNNLIISNGTNWITESGDTARHALGLGTADNVIFNEITVENGNINQSKIGQGVNSGQYVVFNTTTDNTATELFIDGSSQRLVLSDLTSWLFDIQVVARRTDALGETTGFNVSGCIERDNGASSVAIVGDDSIEGNEGSLTWCIVVNSDTTNGSLRIQVTGEVGKTILWAAYVRTVEVSA